jgi:hypothetical protein
MYSATVNMCMGLLALRAPIKPHPMRTMCAGCRYLGNSRLCARQPWPSDCASPSTLSSPSPSPKPAPNNSQNSSAKPSAKPSIKPAAKHPHKEKDSNFHPAS